MAPGSPRNRKSDLKTPTTIPEREAWLWKNPKALGAVILGLEQARASEFVEGPDIAADAVKFGLED